MTTPDLQAILREYQEGGLAADWEGRLSAPSGRPVYAYIPKGDLNTDPHDADMDEVQGWLSDAREQLGRRDFHAVKGRVDQMMADHQVPEEYRSALSMGVLETNVEIFKVILARAAGHAGEHPNAPHAPQQATALANGGPLLSDFVKSYADFGTKEKGWKGQTLAQNNATFALLQEWCGDKRLQHYTRSDLGSFYEALRKLPAMYAKAAVWRGLTVKEIIAQTEGSTAPRLSMKTIKRHFSALGGLFSQAIRLGTYDLANPAHGFVFPTKGRASSSRQMWEGPELKKLFQSPVWTGSHPRYRSKPGPSITKDERYWLPLLGVYHGNRLEEFAQLRREDVKQQDGIWYFDITDAGERQLKNEQSKRRVPLHPKIVELGFLDYVQNGNQNPQALIFPELEPGGPDNKLGYYFTKWFTKYRRDIGVYEPKLDYHSFRHSVTTKLFSKGVSPTLVDELTGHEGKGTSASIYYKGAPLAELHKAIEKIEWPEVEL